MKKKVIVLMGAGPSEREVSLSSGAGVLKALLSAGYDASALDIGLLSTGQLVDRLEQEKPDVIFNALHGHLGEDGTVQGLLDLMQIPYTHSGVLASALAMDKPMTKRVCASVGIPLAEDRIVDASEVPELLEEWCPCVVKPLADGSSVGVQVVMQPDAFRVESRESRVEDKKVLLEKYVPGREIQVTVLDGRALGAIEIRPKQGFYDYAAKYTAGLADHLMPAPIAEDAYAKVLHYAEKAHAILGCRGLTRSDFRYDDTQGEPGRLVLLEVNTQPGMTPLSLAPETAAHAGIDYEALVTRLVETAKWG